MPTAEVATIKDLILAAAEGTAAGIEALRTASPPIEAELEEFEIEVNYACTTEWSVGTEFEVALKFKIISAKFSAKTSYKRTTTYGLKVRFVFRGKKEET